MRFIFCLIVCFSCKFLLAQKTELYVRAGSGFFFFSGKSAVKHQNAGDAIIRSNPNTNPYGKSPAFSATLEGVIKQLVWKSWIVGTGIGYQSLSARSSIDTLFMMGDIISSIDTMRVNASSVFRAQFINLSPFLGKRFRIGRTTLDITAGLEFGFLVKSLEQLDFNMSNYPLLKNRDRQPRKTDMRFRAEAAMNIKKLLFFTSYAKGLSNYYTLYLGGQPEAYSHFINIGIGYRLK
jgi:hypothetical protein